MSRNPTSRWQLLAGAGVVSILVSALLVLGAELAVRAFTDVRFFGNSRNLFADGRNAPNVHAISFDESVYTDSDGFRVPGPSYRYPSGERTILFLGDSIAFGPGVPEEQTFIGMLRQSRPDWAIYNSAVIGYGVDDYLAALQRFRQQPSEVYLVFCLNDVSNASAANIAQANWVEQMRRASLLDRTNAFLRDTSKLYLYVKNGLTDPGRRYFLADWQQYHDESTLQHAVERLHQIATSLASADVPFTVILSPYEYQLRKGAGSDVLLPQRKLARLLESRRIDYVDAMDWFEPGEGGYFLRFDPMHFSARGHEVMYRGLMGLLAPQRRPAS